MVEIREVEKVKLKNPIIIEGFPGIGMIGTITTTYLTEKLNLKLVGYFASPNFPPVAAIHNYTPVSPARIYASEKYNLIVVFSELVIPSALVMRLSEAIIGYAKKKKVKAIYSLAGIASQAPDQKIYAICSTKKIMDDMKAKGFELVKEGATQGVSGVLIAECAAAKIPAANLMVQTSSPLDPRAAARLLDSVMPLFGVKVETKPLVQEAEKIEAKLKEAMDKLKPQAPYDKTTQNMYG